MMRQEGMRRVALVAVAGLAAAASPAPKAPPGVVTMSPEQQKTVQLTVEEATARPVVMLVHVPGTVAFAEDHISLLRPLAPSRVVRLLTEPGQSVRRGDVLAELDIPSLLDAEAQREGARAAVREAKAGAAVARAALQRGIVLAADGSLARSEADRRRVAVAQALASQDVAVSRLAMLEAQIGRLNPRGAAGRGVLLSPLDGTVAQVGIATGAFVDSAADAFLIADLSVVVVRASVPESEVALVAVGDPAAVRLAAGGDGRVWHGRVVGLDAAVDAQSRALNARIVVQNDDRALRAGMFTDVTLTSDRGRSGVMVPPAAIQMVGDRHVAFVPAGDNRFQSRDVTLGVERADMDEIRSGLQAGDRVVTKGSFELKSLLQQDLLGGN